MSDIEGSKKSKIKINKEFKKCLSVCGYKDSIEDLQKRVNYLNKIKGMDSFNELYDINMSIMADELEKAYKTIKRKKSYYYELKTFYKMLYILEDLYKQILEARHTSLRHTDGNVYNKDKRSHNEI